MTENPAGLLAARYRLLRPLGEGGMGVVWEARDELLDRAVAVKELAPNGLSAAELGDLRQRAIREARAIARVDHPNVVRIFDVIHDDEDAPWIVMELVRSRSLHDIVNEDGPLTPERAAEIGLAVLTALRAAHAVGILHRDVKPANVLVATNGRIVLTDFGLAEMAGDSAMTRTGVVLGSPSYLAPERALDEQPGPPADLWSLGATLYAAVEGRPPYEKSSPMATLAALMVEPPPPPQQAGPLRPLLEALLRKKPSERAAPDEAERLLKAVANGTSPTNDSPLPSSPAPPATPAGPHVPASPAQDPAGTPASISSPAATSVPSTEPAAADPPISPTASDSAAGAVASVPSASTSAASPASPVASAAAVAATSTSAVHDASPGAKGGDKASAGSEPVDGALGVSSNAVDGPPAASVAVDKWAVDQAAVDQAAVDQAAVDKTAVDRAAVKKTAVDAAVAGKAASGNSAVGGGAEDGVAVDKAVFAPGAAEAVAPTGALVPMSGQSTTAALMPTKPRRDRRRYWAVAAAVVVIAGGAAALPLTQSGGVEESAGGASVASEPAPWASSAPAGVVNPVAAPSVKTTPVGTRATQGPGTPAVPGAPQATVTPTAPGAPVAQGTTRPVTGNNAATVPAAPPAPTTKSPTKAPTTQAPAPGFQIWSHETGTCLDARNTGGDLQLWSCQSRDSQRFTFPSDGTMRVLGMCVRIKGTGNGARLGMGSCTGSDAQQFDLNQRNDLVSLKVDKCVDVTDNNAGNGVPAQIWDCAGTDNQKWN